MNSISIFSATQVITYDYNELTDNGNVHGSNKRWFTLIGAGNRVETPQAGNRDGYTINNGRFIATTPITITPLANGDVDLYFE